MPRIGSSRPGRLGPLTFEGEEAVGQEGHGGVVVEARPAAPLEVVEPELALELLVAALDLPALLPGADGLLDRGVRAAGSRGRT